MGFTIDGAKTPVYSCTACGWIQAKKHFRDGPTCAYCNGEAEKVDEITETTGMTEFAYRKFLDWLVENQKGVGQATRDAIEQEFPDGDEFKQTCKDAYENRNFEPLTAVSGVGKETAHTGLALGAAAYYDWENGDAEPFDFSSE